MKRFKKVEKTSCFLQTSEGVVSYFLARSPRRRSLAIIVDEDASVTVRSPKSMPQREIDRFIKDKVKWINSKVEEAQRNLEYLERKKFKDGNMFLFMGRKYPITVVQAQVKISKVEFDDFKWIVTIPEGLSENEKQKKIRQKLLDWYRKQAEEVLGGRIFHYSRIMQVEPKHIAVRTQKRLWGCCDYHKQSIHLNWQIILSPINVIDYIVVHELAHLTVPNHSKRFWNRVAKYLPEYTREVQWLKSNALDLVLPGV